MLLTVTAGSPVPTGRLSYELFWVHHQPFFLSCGYNLRPRYHPTWVPSRGTKNHETEDALLIIPQNVIDAVRVQDNLKVVIKRVSTATSEIAIGTHLSSAAMSSDSRNHTVPLLETLYLPDDESLAFIVMPMLLGFDKLPFRRFGEFAEAVQQFLQGLEFMHEHNIVHRDACFYNLMMDTSKAMPRGFHFARWRSHDGLKYGLHWHDRWSVRPVKYYFIDFGLSHQYPRGRKNILDGGIFGQDRTVPEMSITVPYDPFKADVYQLGNVFLKAISEYEGLEGFSALATTMICNDPQERPTASETLTMFEGLISSLQPDDLKRRVWPKKLLPRERFEVKYLGSKTLFH
ncbi:hypothetical protein Hypma_014745 [Hypsizygus marmoreus]|uniref:Protein kinase domain-containing protein n=1 Tax=Hypsizygus marmoreus TaxID=39966 RepID=A0A369JH09_HYPMA|nr:hypothetical protein Hypma_014745 [Hypsizygus marmoreus]